MARRRVARLNEQFKREIAEILRGEVKDPRVGDVTLTAVEVAPDLSSGRVFVNVLGDDDRKREALAGLRAASPYIRGELGRRLRIRRAPELRFELDRSLERALRIERLLDEVATGAPGAPPEPDDVGGTAPDAGEADEAAGPRPDDRPEGGRDA